MDCVQFGRLIDSYLDDRRAGTFLGEFHAHGLACRRCSRALSDDIGIEVPPDAESVVHRSMSPGNQVRTGDDSPDAADPPIRWTEYRLQGKEDHPAE